jgi:hypothetical protein
LGSAEGVDSGVVDDESGTGDRAFNEAETVELTIGGKRYIVSVDTFEEIVATPVPAIVSRLAEVVFPAKPLGTHIRARRIVLGLTQEDAAERSRGHVSLRSWSRIERNGVYVERREGTLLGIDFALVGLDGLWPPGTARKILSDYLDSEPK